MQSLSRAGALSILVQNAPGIVGEQIAVGINLHPISLTDVLTSVISTDCPRIDGDATIRCFYPHVVIANTCNLSFYGAGIVARYAPLRFATKTDQQQQ